MDINNVYDNVPSVRGSGQPRTTGQLWHFFCQIPKVTKVQSGDFYDGSGNQDSDKNEFVQVIQMVILDIGNDHGNNQPERKVTQVEEEAHLQQQCNVRESVFLHM